MKPVARGCIKTNNQRLKKLLALFGPGFITGAADDDPSGISTYAQAGALFGYKQLWLAPFSFPFMLVLQEMCGRIGLVTGKGLAGVIKQHYGRTLLYSVVGLLIIANVINIGADLGAMAASAALIVPIPYYALLLDMTFVTIALEILVPYRVYTHYLKYLAFSLIAYVCVAFMVQQDWVAIFWSTILPHIIWSKEYMMNIVAIMGTTISPYLFFWQASQEVEEEVLRERIVSIGNGKPHINGDDIRAMQMDTFFGMLFSNIIMFFIMLTVASTLHRAGMHTVQTAAQAALALQPLAGSWSAHLFALGVVGTGLLAVPTLAGSVAYAVAEIADWPQGLSLTYRQAPGFYGVIGLITLVGLLADISPISPFMLLYYAAVINGIITPLLICVLLCIANNTNIMDGYTNTRLANILGIVVGFFMLGAVGSLLWSYLM